MTRKELIKNLQQARLKLNTKKLATQPLTNLEKQDYELFLNNLELLANDYREQAISLGDNSQQKSGESDKEFVYRQEHQSNLIKQASLLFNAYLSIEQYRKDQGLSDPVKNEDIVEKILELENLFVHNIIGNKSYQVEGSYIQKLQNDLLDFRQAKTQQLEDLGETYNNRIAAANEEKTQNIYLERAQGAKAIAKSTSDFIKSILKAELEASIKATRKNPPCNFSIGLLGSLSKEGATPFSDLEFAIIIEDKGNLEVNQRNKEYFRNVARLTNLKITNLQESMTPKSQEPWVNFDDLHPMGIGFDLGGKTPLNRKREEDVIIEGELSYPAGTMKYDLITTPTELKNYFDEKYYNIDKFLSFEIEHPVFLSLNNSQSSKEPLQQYQQQVQSHIGKLDLEKGKPLYQLRALKILYEGIDQFHGENLEQKTHIEGDLGKYATPLSTEQSDQGKLTNIKQDLYRLGDRLIEGIANFYNIESENRSSFALLSALERQGVISATIKQDLEIMVAVSVELRGKFDLKSRTQGQQLMPYDLEEDMDLLQRYYATAIPFGQKVKEFFEDQAKSFQDKKTNVTTSFLEKRLYVYNKTTEAIIYSRFLQYEKAIRCYEQSLESAENRYGPNHKEVAIILNELGSVYSALNNYKEQIKHQERALRIVEAYYPKLQALILNNLGIAYGNLDNHLQKIEYGKKALNILEAHYGDNHFQIAFILSNLGNAYGQIGEVQMKKECLERALEIKKKSYGNDHPQTATTLSNLGNICGDLGDHRKQIDYQKTALGIFKSSYGSNNPKFVSTLANLGQAYYNTGKYAKQIECQKEALTLLEDHGGEKNHALTMKILTLLSTAHYWLGQHNEQIECCKKALEVGNRCGYREDSPHIARILVNLGNAYNGLGRYDEQIKYCEKVPKIFFDSLQFSNAATALVALGNAYGNLGNHRKQIEYCQKALETEERIYGRNHPNSAITLGNLGNGYGGLGDYETQIEYCGRALEIKIRQYGPNHDQTNRTRNGLRHGYLGLANQKLLEGNIIDAKQLYHKSVMPTLSNDPFSAEIHNDVLQQLLEAGKPHLAIQHYKILTTVLEVENSIIFSTIEANEYISSQSKEKFINDVTNVNESNIENQPGTSLTNPRIANRNNDGCCIIT